MASYQSTNNEETFNVKPIGVRYKCEFCNEGYQELDKSAPMNTSFPQMFTHICTKCGKSMLLPKVYPYIEWET